MVWIFDADGRRKKYLKNATHKNGGKTTKRKTLHQIYQIRKDMEMRGENWEEIQEKQKVGV